MVEREFIKASLSSVRKDLDEVIARIQNGILDWAPTESMRTIKGQLVEILATEQNVCERLQGLPRRSYQEVEAPFLALNDIQDFTAKLAKIRSATLSLLESLEDQELAAPAAVSEAFTEYVDLKVVPKSELFRFIARHESYHAGQLTSYLWSRGDNPYDWS